MIWSRRPSPRSALDRALSANTPSPAIPPMRTSDDNQRSTWSAVTSGAQSMNLSRAQHRVLALAEEWDPRDRDVLAGLIAVARIPCACKKRVI